MWRCKRCLNPLPDTKLVSYVYGVEEGVVEKVEHVRCPLCKTHNDRVTRVEANGEQ